MTEARPANAGPYGRLLRHSFVYGLGFVGTSALALLLTPLYTRFIAPDGYGRLRLVGITLQLVSIAASLGLVESLFRFFYQQADRAEARALTSTIFVSLVVSLALFALPLFALAGPLAALVLDDAAFAGYFRIAAATLVVSGLTAFVMALLRIEERSGWYVALSIAQIGGALSLNIFFVVVLAAGVEGVLWATLAANVFAFVLAAPYLARRIAPTFDRRLFAEALSFGGPLVPASLAAYLISSSSLYFLRAFSTFDETGVFSLALQFGSAISILVVTPFDMTWSPMKYKLAQEPGAGTVYGNVLVYFALVVLWSVIGLAALIDDAMVIAIDARYRSAALYIGAIGLCHALFGVYRIVSLGLDLAKKTSRRAAIIVFSLAVNLGLNFLLAPPFGAWGAVAALAGAYLTMTVAAYLAAQKVYPVPYPLRRLIAPIAAAGVHYGLARLVETGSPVGNLGLRTAIVLLYPATLWVLGVFTPPERRQIAAFVTALAAGRRGGRA
ncbi:MAG: hypothetical protein C4523_05725 [Myxococcales bacterium]|nr:MAG: hypothetical protein C4523_05725 [Myxococcales bacterium]